MKSTFKDRPVLPKQDGFGGWYSRGYFPHFDGEGITQHVCLRLCDSLPQRFLSQLRAELKAAVAAGAGSDCADHNHEWRKRIHEFLDSGYGSCALRNENLAKVIEDSLLHFDGDRYALHAWCVMPNHVHTLFTPHDGHKMSTIVHSWKSFTAHECNKLLGQTGQFWDREPFDRYIRNERHFRNTLAYIEENPVKAGLCERPWLWSSARRR